MAGKRLQKGQYQAVPGKYYGTPKEVWGFRTRASSRAVQSSCGRFLSPPIVICSSWKEIFPASNCAK